MEKIYGVICGKYRKLEKLKISYPIKKTLALYIICGKCKNVDGKIFKEEDSIEIFKITALINNKEIYNYAWRKHESRI